MVKRVSKARSNYLLLDRQVSIAKADVGMFLKKRRIKMEDLKRAHGALEKANDVIQQNLKRGKYATEKARQRIKDFLNKDHERLIKLKKSRSKTKKKKTKPAKKKR